MITDKNEIKKLIIANEIMHHNWINKQSLDKGLDVYKQSNPKEIDHMKKIYDRMSEALRE